MTTTTAPRLSGIPTPGKPSGIPTPGRSRATSSVGHHALAAPDIDYMSRAFADAIKANDPAQHRSGRVSDISTVSGSQSGRRSVTGRPSSVASSSSTTSLNRTSTAERTKAPSTVRPPSRHSDIFTRSSSRTGRTFELGDNVRIESLGYEGTLRYLGEIDGKLGLWAGVELSGGFAGKGKNNGTVSGRPYFTCPPDCGVFVATTKLSSPTVGPGASYRPSSVASSRSGRITPLISGRVTPSNATSLTSNRVAPSSTSKGRATPASGRITPSLSSGRITPNVTPAPRSRPRLASKPISNNVPTVAASEAIASDSLIMGKITAGSRASKYLQMTAQQLNARNAHATSPSRRTTRSHSPALPLSSPSPGPLTSTSPTRPSVSPFNTPKAGMGGRTSNIGTGASTPIKGRPSITTPRARIPSAIAMPPPASPVTSTSASLNDHATNVSINREISSHDRPLSDLVLNGRSPPDKGAPLMSGNSSFVPRPESATLPRSAEQQAHIDRLQSRLEALEYENNQLRSADVSNAEAEVSAHTGPSQVEEATISRISLLETQLQATNRSLDERHSKIISLEQTIEGDRINLERQTCENETRLKEAGFKLDDSAVLVKSLQTAIQVKDGLEFENKAILKAKDAELTLLQARLEKVESEMEDEKRDLGTQVDELRRAGQETIALYEERLNAADTIRYELEDKIVSLEARLRNDPQSSPPSTASRFASSAAQIDNEILRDQVRHLQKKIGNLEDAIEDRRSMSEKEEAAVRERMKRMKDKEDAIKRELSDGRKEVERMLKSEVNARDRVQEIEEAFRESTLALENARAEVEGLRTELANLDSIAEELSDLKKSLHESRASEQVAWEQVTLAKHEAQAQAKLSDELKQTVKALHSTNCQLEHLNEDWQAKFSNEHDIVLTLRQSLEDSSGELDVLKKRYNRDFPVNTMVQDPSRPSPQSTTLTISPKHDLAATREEIKGLKHIVQDLQKENLAASQSIKLLESENKLLEAEAYQLRQELKLLEDSFEESILKEEKALSSANGTSSNAGSGGTEFLQAVLDQKMKLETELDQSRKRLAEAEMKNARTTHDLNKEISELEALVESKIYREDELEQELERMKDKLARNQKKLSKNILEPNDTRHRMSSTSCNSLRGSPGSPPKQDICEICERPGHDLFNCDLLKEDTGAISRSTTALSSNTDLFCEDCESYGHLATGCPHSLDVF